MIVGSGVVGNRLIAEPLYHVCSLFAICSFQARGAGLF
jgi:hypothetical protein